jgi:hypothetical protein
VRANPLRPWLAVVVVAAAGCQSAPAPRPPVVEAAEPEAPADEPLVLGEATTKSQTLRGVTLVLQGDFGPDDTASALTWTAKVFEQEVGAGSAAIAPDPDGRFTVELPLKWGSTREELANFQQQALEVVVEVKTDGAAPLVRTRTVRIRGPLLPTATVVSVQASREGPLALGVTYLLSIRNPNPYEIKVGTLRYEARLSGRPIVKGELPLSAKVPASADNMFEIPAMATTESYGKDIAALLRQTLVPWGFGGTLSAGGIEIPIDVQGEMRLSAN